MNRSILLLAVVFVSGCFLQKNDSGNPGAPNDPAPVPTATPSPTPSYDPNYSFFNFKLYLAGAMNNAGTEMKTTLAPYLPTTDPYGLGGNSPNINSLPNVVDWIHIELRDNATPYSLVQSVPALLLTNGQVVDVDGSSYPKVTQEGTFYIFIKHRNHLPVQAEDAVTFAHGTLAEADLSGPVGFMQLLGFPDQVISFNQSTIYAIKYGELTGDCEISTDDEAIAVAEKNAGATGYQAGDINFDGVVDATDILLAPWNGYSSINNSALCGK